MSRSRLAEAGVRLLHDSSGWSAIGLLEGLKLAPALLAKLNWTKREIATNPPDALVLIDFGAFNVRVARAARKARVPTLYYLPPGSWSRRPRSRNLGSLVDTVATQFPWSVGHYLGGARVVWVGHPVLDAIQEGSPAEAISSYNGHYPNQSIALLPGSRKLELELMTPILADTAILIRKEFPAADFLLPVASGVRPEAVERPFRERGLAVTLLQGGDYCALRRAQVAVVASGTATLELACLGVPMVVIYRAPIPTYLQYKVLRGLLRGQRRVGLPNLLLERDVVPEYLQGRCRPELIAREAVSLLRNPERRERMRADLAEAVAQLGPAGASSRTADLVVELIESRREAMAASASK